MYERQGVRGHRWKVTLNITSPDGGGGDSRPVSILARAVYLERAGRRGQTVASPPTNRQRAAWSTEENVPGLDAAFFGFVGDPY